MRPDVIVDIATTESSYTSEQRSTSDSSLTQAVTNSVSSSSSSSELGPSAILGIVTMEDVLEAMIGEDIVDETDLYLNPKTKVENPNKLVFRQTLRKRKRSRRKKLGVPKVRRSRSVTSIRFPHSWSPLGQGSNSESSLNFPKSS